MKPTLVKKANQTQLIFGILVFLSSFFFSMLYVNRTVSDVMGWQTYSGVLMHDGQIPYRDFFYYIPIGYLMKVDFLWRLVGENFLLQRVLGCATRSLMMVIIYYLLCHLTSVFNAFITTAGTYCFFLTCVIDSFGDYNMDCILVSYISALLFYHFIIEERSTGNLRGRGFLYLAASFAVSAIDFFIKQSSGVILLFAQFLILILYIICCRFPVKKILATAAGAVLGVVVGSAPLVLWLIRNSALRPFFDQVLFQSLNSKGVNTAGSVSESLLVKTLLNVFSPQAILVGLMVLLLLLARKKGMKKLAGFALIATCSWIFMEVLPNVIALAKAATVYFYAQAGLAAAVVFGLLIWWVRNHSELSSDKAIALVFTFCLFTAAYSIIYFTEAEQTQLIGTFSKSALFQTFGHYGLVVAFALSLYCLVLECSGKGNNLRVWLIFEAMAVLIASCMQSILNNGTGSFSSQGVVLFELPVFFALILEYSGKRWRKAFLSVFICISVLFSGYAMSTTLYKPYSWWGWTENPITDVDRYTIDSDLFTGFQVSKRDANTLNQVSRLISENTEEDDFVFIFPYSVVYRMMTGRKTVPTFTPVYFFDVCPDSMAQADCEILKEQPPKMIVWKDVGEGCWTTHERLFRNGNRLGQRDIREWFESVKETEYTLIGQVYNQSVYLRNSETPSYTYFQGDEDMTSQMFEIDTRTTRRDCVRAALKRVIPEKTDTIHSIICLVLVLIAVWVMFKGSLWMLFSWIIAGVYLATSSEPMLLLAYSFAGLALLVDPRIDRKRGRIYAALMFVLAMSFFVSWTAWWPSFYRFVAAGLNAVVLILVLVEMFFRSMKNEDRVE